MKHPRALASMFNAQPRIAAEIKARHQRALDACLAYWLAGPDTVEARASISVLLQQGARRPEAPAPKDKPHQHGCPFPAGCTCFPRRIP